MMRQIESSDITSLVERLCIEVNCFISKDIEQCFIRVRETERSLFGREILELSFVMQTLLVAQLPQFVKILARLSSLFR